MHATTLRSTRPRVDPHLILAITATLALGFVLFSCGTDNREEGYGEDISQPEGYYNNTDRKPPKD